MDVDWYVEDDQPKHRILIDKEKAALHGISEDEIAKTLRVASAGEAAGLIHAEADGLGGRFPVDVQARPSTVYEYYQPENRAESRPQRVRVL